jgi:hypothetical protein
MRHIEFRCEIEMVGKGHCAGCGDYIIQEDFRDEVSIREFGISGMCQFCQDRFFGKNNK